MKKGTLIFNGAVVVVLVVLTWLHFRSSGVVYVDTNILMQKYEGMKDVRAEFEKKSKAWQAQSDTLVQDWQTELRAFEKGQNSMTTKEKQQKAEELRYKQQQIGKYKQTIDKKVRDEQEKLTQPVISSINEYISEYGKKHGYKLILGANGSGSLLYADKKIDITDVILEGLNKDYRKR